MNRIELYQGQCVGGPHHGKMLAHDSLSYAVVLFAGGVVGHIGDEPTEDAFRYGEYRYVNGAWVWRAPLKGSRDTTL